ncbi:exodeoxyribonuclease I [Candidatus Thioglobus sp.]|nr:exodeoxyribonuclease I [Candidatus Thioglobus sp.]
MKTFYWYDYETFGLSPRIHRIAQFAGIRTDENLNILDEHMFYCKPTNDCLPTPEACKVTGITPQYCDEKGLIEHEFIIKINKEFSVPDTCIVGYNSIAFDDEFTRYTLFRNFLDPYAWHWQNNNTRWDILNVARFCYAHKEEDSLNWVVTEKNRFTLQLEKIAPANNIEHSNAHDAMADVRATIGIAKIIKQKQPKFFDYALSLNNKKTVKEKLNYFYPMLLTSQPFGSKCAFTKMVVAITTHPEYQDRAIVYSLDQDPEILVDEAADDLKKLLFSKKDDLPKGKDRLKLSEVVFNKSPMFVCSPNSDSFNISDSLIEKFQIDMAKCMRNLSYIQDNRAHIEEKIQSIYKRDSDREPNIDVDQSLYDNFISNKDRKICDEIQHLSVDQISAFRPNFEDRKLSKLFLNFKARNYPETLTEDEQEDWFEIVQSRVQSGENGYLSFEQFEKSLNKLKEAHPDRSNLWQALEEYANRLL